MIDNNEIEYVYTLLIIYSVFLWLRNKVTIKINRFQRYGKILRTLKKKMCIRFYKIMEVPTLLCCLE